MRVLVTGAFGYIGRALVHRLAVEHTVVALGRRARPAPPGVEVVEGDVLAPPPLPPVDAVIHLAAAPAGCDLATAVRINVVGSQRIRAAVPAARYLLASSIAVYAPGRAPYRESDPTGPTDLFGATKEAAEPGWTALRLPTVYGGEAAHNGVIDLWARLAAAGANLPIPSGAGRIDCLVLDDAVDAFARALLVPALPPVLNVGSGTPVRPGEVAAACITAANKIGRSPRMVPAEPAPGPDRSLAPGLAIATLGWQPRRRLQGTMDALVAREAAR